MKLYCFAMEERCFPTQASSCLKGSSKYYLLCKTDEAINYFVFFVFVFVKILLQPYSHIPGSSSHVYRTAEVPFMSLLMRYFYFLAAQYCAGSSSHNTNFYITLCSKTYYCNKLSRSLEL